MKIFLVAVIKNGYGIWEAKLQAGKHEKSIYQTYQDVALPSLYVLGATKVLETLTRHMKIKFYHGSGYLHLAFSRFILEWEKQGWNSNNEIVRRMKNLAVFAEKHSIMWESRSIERFKPLKDLYSLANRRLRDEFGHKIDLF